MDLKALLTLIDSAWNSDKTNGDLGKVLSQIKDTVTELHGTIADRDKTIAENQVKYDDLQTRNNTLVEANGKMLIERTVTTTNPANNDSTKQSEEDEYTIDDLIYGGDEK